MRLIFATILGLWLGSLSAQAEIVISGLKIKQGHHAAAAHLLLENTGPADDALLRVESNAFETIELHTISMIDNIMRMRRVAQFDIPAGAQHALKPRGDHLMLFNPRAHDGDITFTFFFTHAPSQTHKITVDPHSGH